MHLVAHRQAAGDERIEGDAAAGAQRSVQERRKLVAQPREPREHLGVVAAEAHHLAQAFVNGAERAVPLAAVLDDQQRLAARGDPGHRPHAAMVMVRREAHAAALGELLGLGELRCPALVDDRTAYRAAQRSAHARPRERRAGVQDEPLALERWNELARAPYTDEPGIGGEDARERLLIGALDSGATRGKE